MSTRIKIRQRDITDCGATCLASVAAHYRLLIPVARIRQLASTDQKGTSVLGIVEAAQKIGFQAKGVKGAFESLYKIPKPAIAHTVLKNQMHHYVVIYGVTKKYVVLMDPADGYLRRKPHDEFKKDWTGVLVLLIPDETFQPANNKASIGRRFLQLVQPYRTIVIQAIFGAFVYTLLGLTTSIYVQKLVDYVLPDANRNLLNLLSIVMIILLLLQLFIGTVKSYFNLKTGQRMDAALILSYYRHILKLPQAFFDTMRVGEIISRVNDAVKIRTFISDTALNIFVNLLIILFSFALMFTYYWKLALILLLVIPLYVCIYVVVNRINRKTGRQLMEDAAELESQLVESLNSMTTIKRFGLEEFVNYKTETRFVTLLKSVFQAGSTAIYAGSISDLVNKMFIILLLWIGGYFVIQHEITPGELFSFYALIGYFTGPAASLVSANRSIQEALVAADRLFEIMDLECESRGNKMILKPDMVGDILFNSVDFRYGSRVTVFENLTLLIPVGKITAIIGGSGSGKSTLLSLIQGLYPIQNGHIQIGNYDIEHLDLNSLRQIVSVVPQKVDLFAGNVIENIAVGQTDPDMQRIIDICGQLGITIFIEKLSAGFYTYLGENGAILSGGQKQRIAIARALYRDPSILILDEATSALDSSSEQFVQRTLSNLRKMGKTIILITHRLVSVQDVDKIIVLEEGVVAEEGNHSELLKRGNQYARYWQQQSNYPKACLDCE